MWRVTPFLVPAIALALAVSACGGGPIVAVESESHEFTLAESGKVVVRTYDGAISVTAGADGKVSATVKKTAHGWSEDEAVSHLKDVLVTYDQDGSTVTVTAKERPGIDSGAEVTLTVPAGSVLDLATSNGKVTSSGTSADITAGTSNGAVQLTGGRGTIKVTTSNGRVTLAPLDGTLVSATSSNGDITYQGAPQDGESSFQTSNGSIDISMPPATAFVLDATTSNGNISCDFPFTAMGTTGAALHATVGENPPVHITASTSNGDVRVRKLP